MRRELAAQGITCRAASPLQVDGTCHGVWPDDRYASVTRTASASAAEQASDPLPIIRDEHARPCIPLRGPQSFHK
jgi:hypothetical protein